MKELIAIMGFGALGALARFWITALSVRLLGAGFPYGTLIANTAGCLVMGLLMSLALRLPIPKHLLSGLVVGFLGALTTFSAFGFATFVFFREGAVGPALANIALNLAMGLLAVWAGASLGRLL